MKLKLSISIAERKVLPMMGRDRVRQVRETDPAQGEYSPDLVSPVSSPLATLQSLSSCHRSARLPTHPRHVQPQPHRPLSHLQPH